VANQQIACLENPLLEIRAEACCASLLTVTKRIVGRVAASQMASASAAPFFWRLTKGFT